MIGIYVVVAAFLPCLTSSAPTRQPVEPDVTVDFNALLDGSLGNIPALWLTSRSILAEVAQSSKTEHGQLVVPFHNTTFYLPATKLSSRDDRTDKENGAVAAAFISSMIVPAVTNSIDDGVTKGLCTSLVNGATGMVGAVVGQEAGKTLYPPGNGTYENGTSAPEIEQGIVPGAFIGSVATNTLGTALTKTICQAFVPELMKTLEYAEAGPAERVARSMNQGLREVLTSRLAELEVGTARAVQFASQMEETIRLVDSTGSLAEGFEYLNRELVATTADLAEAVGSELVSKLAISSLVQLSHNTLVNLPIASTPGAGLMPFEPAAKPMKLMSRFTSHFTSTQEFAKTLGGQIEESVNTVAPAMASVAQGVQSAAEDVGSSMAGAAGKVIKGATDLAKNILNSLPNPLANLPNPFDSFFHHGGHHAAPESNGGGNGGGHCAQATVTAHATVTVTTTLPQYGMPTPGRNMGSPTRASCTSYQTFPVYMTLPVYTTSTQYANEVVTQTQTVPQYIQIPTYVTATATQTVEQIVQIPQYTTTTATQTVQYRITETVVYQTTQTVQYAAYSTAMVTQTIQPDQPQGVTYWHGSLRLHDKTWCSEALGYCPKWPVKNNKNKELCGMIWYTCGMCEGTEGRCLDQFDPDW